LGGTSTVDSVVTVVGGFGAGGTHVGSLNDTIRVCQLKALVVA
jgi:hypothetical protein